MTNQLNQKLFIQKLYGAVTMASSRNQQDFMLRPSNIGQCPLRLRFDLEDSKLGKGEARDPRQQWPALQGTVSEELMTTLLEMAGAEIIKPPVESNYWDPDVEPDPETGFKPHLDALIRWPEVGIADWSLLECKNQRVTAHIANFTDGVYAERMYWFQSVSYLKLARLAIEHYALWEKKNLDILEQPGPWTQMHLAGVKPAGIVYFSTAKDPSTARMMLSQRIKPAQYEQRPDKMKPEQFARMDWKAAVREKLETFGGDIAFYPEYIDGSDPSVLEAWYEILNTKRQVEASVRPEPLYNIAVSDDDLSAECRWFCPHLERHRMMGFTTITPDQELDRLERRGQLG